MDLSGLAKLSERQRECLRLLFANLSIKDIGGQLNISPVTVKGHLKNARQLLGVNRSMQAAVVLVEYERDTLGVDPPKRLGIERQSTDTDAATAPDNPAEVARKRYNLTILQRIGLIVAIALGAVALAGALLVGSEAITQIFRAERISISDYPYRH